MRGDRLGTCSRTAAALKSRTAHITRYAPRRAPHHAEMRTRDDVMHNGAIMPSEVRHRVDAGQAYPLVRLTGVLDLQTASRSGPRCWTCSRASPRPWSSTSRGWTWPSPTPRQCFATCTGRPPTGPAAHLALCDPRDAASGGTPDWPVWRDRTEAFAALGTPDLGQRLSLDLDPVVGAARRGREVITEACVRWELHRARRLRLHRGHRDGQQRGRARRYADDRPARRARLRTERGRPRPVADPADLHRERRSRPPRTAAGACC